MIITDTLLVQSFSPVFWKKFDSGTHKKKSANALRPLLILSHRFIDSHRENKTLEIKVRTLNRFDGV